MLILTQAQLDAVSQHAVETYPQECCGIFLGEFSGDDWRVTSVMRAGNLVTKSKEDRYQLDPMDRFRAEQEAKRAGVAIVGFYHSHPDHDVYFSKTDLENSEEYLLGEPWLPPTYAYLVISLHQGKPRDQGAFVVVEGKSHPLELRIQ